MGCRDEVSVPDGDGDVLSMTEHVIVALLAALPRSSPDPGHERGRARPSGDRTLGSFVESLRTRPNTEVRRWVDVGGSEVRQHPPRDRAKKGILMTLKISRDIFNCILPTFTKL